MRTHPLFALAAAIAVAVGSCAPQNPQTRIAANPQMFAALSPQHQELVRQGQLARNMPRDAVFLAWGRADSIFEGSRNTIPVERWDYTASRPVHTTQFFGSYGFGRGPFGAYRGIGLGAGPEVAFIPYRSASVWFERGLVTAWERLR